MASAHTERITFDPYFHWLEVTTSQRPPHPYDLLGLPLFEPALGRIQAAAVRKRDILERCRDTADPERWNEISQQLEAAVATLCDSTAKAILDAELRRATLAERLPQPMVRPTSAEGTGRERAANPVDGLLCVECALVNPRERKFCGGCGKSLWDNCPKCQAAHPRSEQFCGQCGIDLQAYVVERQTWCTSRLDAARQAQVERRFSEALALLREVARVDDPRLDRFARDAKARLDSYQAERKQLEAEAQKSLETARQLLAAHAVERALVTLDDIPVPLRSAEIAQLLATVQERRRQILALTGEIRDILARKDTLELGPRLTRLLELKPDHKEALQLADQLAAKLLAAARKRLERADYAGTLDLLRRIPEVVASAETRQVEQQARAGRWACEQLRRATLATRTQGELVRRTTAQAPQDPAMQRWLQQWQTWLRSPVREAWLAAPDANPVPSATVAGCPVDWFGRSLRLTSGSLEVEEPLRQHPGRWCVALGLALQGIGEAAVAVNLRPPEKGSVWSRLTFGRRKREATSAWGVDVGPSSIKAVRLQWDEKAQQVRVEEAVFLEHASPPDAVKDEVQAADRVAHSIGQFLAAHPVAGHRLCTNVSGLQTLSRWLPLPPLPDKKLDDAVRFAARQQIAFPLEDLVWDYECLEAQPEKKGELVPRRVALVAVKQHVAQARMALWARHSVQPDVLQSDGVALHNWLRYELAGESARQFLGAGPQEITALLDIGSEVTHLVFSGPHTLWCRAIGQAGDDATRLLSRELQLSRSEAELWKREPQRAASWPQLAAALQPHFDQLLGEWQRSRTQFSGVLPEETPCRLLCLGGGAALWGLIDALRIGQDARSTDD